MLTAAHCIGGYDGAAGVTVRYLDGDTLVNVGRASDACFLHPETWEDSCGRSGDTCEETINRPDCFRRDIDRFDLSRDTFGSTIEVDVDGLLGSVDPALPPAAIDGRTTFRYCRCLVADADRPGVRDDCLVALAGISDGCSISDLLAHDALLERDARPWRWTTHAELDADTSFGVRAELPALYDEPTGMFEPEDEDRWRWRLREEDIPRWISDALFPGESFSNGPGNFGLVRGVVWTHTPGEVGAPDFDLARRSLTSHYWSRGIPGPVRLPPPVPCLQPFVPFIVPPIPCPFCVSRFPEPFVGFLCPDFQFDRPVLVFDGFRLEPGLGVPLSGIELFANVPGEWVSASEPTAMLEEDGLRYIALEDGARVIRALVQLDGALQPIGGSNAPPPCQICDPVPLRVASALSPPQPGPPLRRAHAATLSAVDGTLWVLGGRALETNEVLHDVWAYDASTDAWRELFRSGSPLDTVLAATYAPFERALYVLDETTGRHRSRGRRGRRHGRDRDEDSDEDSDEDPDEAVHEDHRGRRHLRLWRVDPHGQRAELMHSWRARRRQVRYELGVDVAGALWVAASRDRGRRHVVGRFAVVGLRVEPLGWIAGRGRLAGPVRAGDRGVTLVVERRRRRDGTELLGYRVADLRDAPGTEEACF